MREDYDHDYDYDYDLTAGQISLSEKSCPHRQENSPSHAGTRPPGSH